MHYYEVTNMRQKEKLQFYYLIPIFLGVIFWLTAGLIFPQPTESANLSGVKNTLSSSRLSYVGAVDATGTTAASSIVTVKTSSLPGWATSDDNFNLFSGDTLMVGSSTTYTVVDVVNDASDNKIQVTPALAGSDDDDNDPVIATRSAQHTVNFTPASAITDGSFRIRIKATGSGSSAASIDGIPDADGFDFTESFDPNWVDCHGAGDTSVEYGGGTNCPAGWTCIFCDYTGNNNTSEKTVDIGTTASNQQPINPAPSSGKNLGEADTYSFYVDHLDSSDNVVDQTQGKIAVVESVRVTAVVEPTIEFEIDGVATDTSVCGTTTTVGTSAPYVAFSTLQIDDFVDAAQELTVATNASSGYSVTTEESHELYLIGTTGPIAGKTIPDTTCDGACDENTGVGWTVPSNNGFGYSLDDANGDVTTMKFEHDDTGGPFLARQFPNIGNGETAIEIMASNAPSNGQDAYVCYRITISATQAAGTYENDITYIATANF